MRGTRATLVAGTSLLVILAACTDSADDSSTTTTTGTSTVVETTPTTVAATTTLPPPTTATTTLPTTTSPTTTTTTTTSMATTTTLSLAELEEALVIETPGAGETVRSRDVVYTGKALPGSRVAAGRWAATIDDDGNWSIVLRMVRSGGNGTVFVMTAPDGREVERAITVNYRPPSRPDPDRPSR